ncbi:FAD-binding oxidoreductase [Halobacillus yeomjeoni]|uniref:FAD-dependent oxidoreductase n=1 Tax=Halobacillus yeomjeoni TaxID=311194 RepID=UPI001CD6F4A4|nr:FAD-binding oxidoreductase [Halobacillus yeomjeoni]MCA0983391.1 FAD-binding oxidoreductase [Halobacillus yeomjeoni]
METELTGRIVTPGDPGYEEARTNLNLFHAKYPDIIVFCQNEQDVINALTYARERETPFRIRGGRHSYLNLSSIDQGMVIDLSDINHVNVEGDMAEVGPGADLERVYKKLWKHRLALPAGTEFSVGVTGLTTGGGIGYLSRAFGLTCDLLKEVRIVLADGKTGAKAVAADRKNHPGLFWAIRGGGAANFGIITSLKFKVKPIGEVSIFTVDWDFDHFEDVYQTWQTWAPFTDEKLTSSIELKTKKQDTLTAEGQYIGPKEELIKLIQPLIKQTDPRSVKVAEVPFNRAFKYFNYPAGNEPAYFKRSGSFVHQLIPPRGIAIMKKFLENSPNEDNVIWQQALAGAVQEKRPSETAFFHRNALIAQEYNSTWKHEHLARRNVIWVEALRKQMAPYTQGDYVNWPDLSIHDWPTSYYGDNFERLREVKTEVDLYNVFHFPQSIPPL